MTHLWNLDTGCLEEWKVPGWTGPLKPLGWGCEVGNWLGFFSQERLDGLACRIHEKTVVHQDQGMTSRWLISLPHAVLTLELEDRLVGPGRMKRSLRVINPGAFISWLGDVVIRLVIPAEAGLEAIVGGARHMHAGKNRYLETEEPEVSLCWPDNRRLNVRWDTGGDWPPSFTRYLYVRDQPAIARRGHRHASVPTWVVHARLLVEDPAAFVYRWARNPLVLWSRGIIGRWLVRPRHLAARWRAAEFGLAGRGTLYGLWPLKPGQSLKMHVIVEATQAKCSEASQR